MHAAHNTKWNIHTCMHIYANDVATTLRWKPDLEKSCRSHCSTENGPGHIALNLIEPWWHCTWTEHPTQSMLGLTPGLSRRSRHNLSLASTHIQSALVWTAIVPLESHKTFKIYASPGRSRSQGTIKSPALVHFLFTWSMARTRTWPQTTLLVKFSQIFLLCVCIYTYTYV